jgi:hypothetical protein
MPAASTSRSVKPSSGSRHIRSLGYTCVIEHPVGDSDLLHIPIGLKAGFGELDGTGRSSIRPSPLPMGSVATSIDLAIDRPIDAGIAKFCDNCRRAENAAPPQPFPTTTRRAGQDLMGYDRYVVDTGRCFPYFAKHSCCSICLPVCVYNHKEWARDFTGMPYNCFRPCSCRGTASDRRPGPINVTSIGIKR